MNTSSNRKLHQLTVKASGVGAVDFSGKRKTVPREQFQDGTGELMIDPAVILNYKPSEYRHITELHMGKKFLQAIHPNIQNFINLEILWINDNKLEKVTNLLPPVKKGADHDVADGARGCVRLKRLYLQNNRLTSLLGDIHRLKYLEILLLGNNLLSNMEQVSSQLSHLRFLKQLDLYGNPLSEEQNYRLYFIQHHKSLILFDNLTVTDSEREKAKETYGFFATGGPGSAVVRAGDGSKGASAKAKVGFGATVLPDLNPTTNRKAGPISPGVAIIESRVQQIKLREKAQQDYEQNREEMEYQKLVDRRRLFHSVWGAKESPSSAFFGDSQSTRLGVSKLFDENSDNKDVCRLIDLASDLELCGEPEKQAEIEKEIKRLKTKLVPERFGDNFGKALDSKKKATATETQKEYDSKLISIIYTPEELLSLQKLFAEKSDSGVASSSAGGVGGGSETLSESDVISIRQVLLCADKLDQKQFTEYVKEFEIDGPKPDAMSSYAAGQRKQNGGVDLRTAMIITANFLPFAQARHEDMRKTGETQITKKSVVGAPPSAAGSASNVAQLLQKLNFLHDHIVDLGKEQNKTRWSTTPAAKKGPSAVAGAGSYGSLSEAQSRMGSGFGAVLSKHAEREAAKNGPRRRI